MVIQKYSTVTTVLPWCSGQSSGALDARTEVRILSGVLRWWSLRWRGTLVFHTRGRGFDSLHQHSGLQHVIHSKEKASIQTKRSPGACAGDRRRSLEPQTEGSIPFRTMRWYRVVRPILSAFRADDRGSNPRTSTQRSRSRKRSCKSVRSVKTRRGKQPTRLLRSAASWVCSTIHNGQSQRQSHTQVHGSSGRMDSCLSSRRAGFDSPMDHSGSQSLQASKAQAKSGALLATAGRLWTSCV